MRLGAIFVAVCMTVIASSAGAVVYFAYGFTGADAAIVAIAALTALALYNAVSTRMNVRSVVGPQLTELSRAGADLARQLAELGRRLAVIESRMERSLVKGEATIHFKQPGTIDGGQLAAAAPELSPRVTQGKNDVTVSLKLPTGSKLHVHQKGNLLLLDLTPGAQAKAAGVPRTGST